MSRKNKGFTLIELMIVIAIIGVFYLGIIPGDVMELAKLAVF